MIYKDVSASWMTQEWNSKSKDSLRALWNNTKCANIFIIGVPDEEKKERD